MIPHWLEETIKPLEKRLSKHPRSPLFAQLAGFYLEAGKPQDALRVCDEGLAHHPMYTTGHLMKGKALVALKMTAEAHREFEIVYSMLPGVESVARLLTETEGEGDALTPTAGPLRDTPELVATVSAPAEEPPPVVEAAHEIQPVEEPPPLPTPVDEPPMAEAVAETATEPAVSSEDSFGGAGTMTEEPLPFGGVETPAGPPSEAPAVEDEETLEAFSARMRDELSGTENTLTLDDYVSGNIGAPISAAGNQIEDLAEKLQGAKITPVINLSSRPSEGGTGGASTGFVTPTLAEIYVKQGWFDDAIRAYKSLASTKPDEKEKFEQRLLEIEEMKKKQGG